MNEGKKREILGQLRELRVLPPSLEIKLLISRLEGELDENRGVFVRFKFVRHYIGMEIDIYEILGKDLYGHFKRLLDTMNENNVCDFEYLDLGQRQVENVRSSLKKVGLVKRLKLGKVSRRYINPAFGVKMRKNIDGGLVSAFKEDNLKFYKITL